MDFCASCAGIICYAFIPKMMMNAESSNKKISCNILVLFDKKKK